VEITVPPLRDRVIDIPDLTAHFVRLYTTKYRKPEKNIAPETLEHLQRYPWPGNIRELQNAVERAVIMSEKSTLTKNDFPFNTRGQALQKTNALNLDDMEKSVIQQAIAKHKGNLSNVAKELGVGRTTLYRKMSKYGLTNNA
jgi:two-component system, NtrC family, response regulator HydG